MAEANVNHIPCVDLSIINQDTIARARQIFEENCLPEFFVASVTAGKYSAKTPCRWTVAYKFRDLHRQYEGGDYAKQLVRRLDAAKPQGTNLMKPGISLGMSVDDGPSYTVNYGVICECEYYEILDFGHGDDGPFDIREIFPQAKD